MRKSSIIFICALGAVAGLAAVAYAAEGDAQEQARTMAAKLAKGDRTPISGIDVPGSTFYVTSNPGRPEHYQHQSSMRMPSGFGTTPAGLVGVLPIPAAARAVRN